MILFLGLMPWILTLEGGGWSGKCLRDLNDLFQREGDVFSRPAHMICIIFMPLTFSHTPEKNIKNESLLIQEVNFPGQAFPYGKDNGTRLEPAQWKRAQGVSHFLFQWVPNILVKFFYSSPSKFLFYSPLQILINFLQISKQ